MTTIAVVHHDQGRYASFHHPEGEEIVLPSGWEFRTERLAELMLDGYAYEPNIRALSDLS